MDYIAPQLYWRIDQAAQSYPVLLRWWMSINSKQRHIYVGNTIARLDAKAWKQREIIQQVTISRSLREQLSLGNIFFSASAIEENRQDIAEKFKGLLGVVKFVLGHFIFIVVATGNFSEFDQKVQHLPPLNLELMLYAPSIEWRIKVQV